MYEVMFLPAEAWDWESERNPSECPSVFQALGQAFMDCCCCCCQECQPTAAQGSPGSTQAKMKSANETSVFFDKAKDTSVIQSISS